MFHDSYIHWGENYKIKEAIDLQPVYKIHKISDKGIVYYLLLQENTKRVSGARLETRVQANLISLGKDSIITHPFFNKEERNKCLNIVLEDFAQDFSILDYIPENRKLKFSYSNNLEEEFEEGEYTFKNGNFHLSGCYSKNE